MSVGALGLPLPGHSAGTFPFPSLTVSLYPTLSLPNWPGGYRLPVLGSVGGRGGWCLSLRGPQSQDLKSLFLLSSGHSILSPEMTFGPEGRDTSCCFSSSRSWAPKLSGLHIHQSPAPLSSRPRGQAAGGRPPNSHQSTSLKCQLSWQSLHTVNFTRFSVWFCEFGQTYLTV